MSSKRIKKLKIKQLDLPLQEVESDVQRIIVQWILDQSFEDLKRKSWIDLGVRCWGEYNETTWFGVIAVQRKQEYPYWKLDESILVEAATFLRNKQMMHGKTLIAVYVVLLNGEWKAYRVASLNEVLSNLAGTEPRWTFPCTQFQIDENFKPVTSKE